MAQWYEMINTFLTTINFCNAKKLNCSLMFIISNSYGRKCLTILLQLDLTILLQLQPCSDLFKVISGIMKNWYELISTFLIRINFCNAKKINCTLMFMISNRDGRKFLSRLVPCNDVFKVISGIMANWYEMINTFIITINFCIAKKMNCAFMFITSNHHGKSVLLSYYR